MLLLPVVTALVPLRPPEEVQALVIGSGISGSCVAHYLHTQDVSLIVAEARDVVGGNVISKKKDGFIWEEGPNSFQPTPTIMRTAFELGIADQLVFADRKLPPWVYFEGKLHALPKNLPGDLLGFDLLSWPGKIRAGLGALGLIAQEPDSEESIEDFVTRHLGREAFERIIDPFVSGVYAGDPKKLSMRAALRKIYRLQTLSFNGGLVPGALVRFQELAKEKKANPPDPKWPTYQPGELGSFREGLQTLPNAIAAQVDVRTGWKLTALEKDGKKWLATFNDKQIRAATVVCTAPAHAMAPLLRDIDSSAAEALEKVYYPPVASVTVAYPKSAFKVPLKGFGNLNPRSQGVRILGTIWSSSLFPGRCPPDYNLLLNYIGGSRDVALKDLSEDAILQEVHSGLKTTLLNDDAPPPKLLGLRLWPTAIPQYEKRHIEDVLNVIDTCEARNPGLYLGGNYRTGVAFGDCVQFGLDQANTILDYLRPAPAAR